MKPREGLFLRIMKKRTAWIKRNTVLIILAAVVCLCACTGQSGRTNEIPDDTSRPGQAEPAATPKPSAGPEKPVIGGTLKLSVGPFDTINPLLTNNADIVTFSEFVCEPFIKLSRTMEPLPCIFTEWVHNDEMTVWEFKVDAAAAFHDGKTVTAGDAKRVVDFILEKGGNYAGNLEGVAACFAVSDDTVQFVLKKPDGLLPVKLKIPLVGWQTLAADIPAELSGTGIFIQESYGGDKIVLRKNENYRDREALTCFDKVEISIFPDENSKLGSDYDIAFVYGTSVGTSILGDDTVVYYFTGSTYDYIALNCSSTYFMSSVEVTPDGGTAKNFISFDNPFQDPDVRLAANLLTSRSNGLFTAASGRGVVSLLPAYSGTIYRRQNTEDLAYNDDRAELLLEKAGYTKNYEDGKWYGRDGEELIIRGLAPGNNFRMVRTLREAAEGLRRIGVTVELHEVSDGEYLEGLRNKEFSMAAMEIELSFWPDLAAVLKTGGELNYSYYTNSLVDAYIEQAEAQEDPEVVVAAYNEIEKLLLEDNPIIGMYVIQNAAIVRNELRGVRRELLFPQDILGSAGEWWIKRAPN